MQESKVDVLIVGAGPAGIMAANALAKAGVNVRIIDQRAGKVAAGQADGIQPRTVEVFQSYGLAERLLREGNQTHATAFYNPGPKGGIERTSITADVNATTARYPFEVTLHQGAIEAMFLDSMRSSGVEVDRPMVPTSLEISESEDELRDPTSYPVKVVLKRLDAQNARDETETVRAKFVLGADGAHSWVRKTLGIHMEGEQTEYIWGVLDIVPSTDFPDIRNKCAIHSTNGSCMIIPREADIVRLYIQLTGHDVLDPATGRVDKAKMNPEKLLEVARKSFAPFSMDTPKEVEWWAIYIIGQRVASHYSLNERVFIAGDACHTHSPKAGQGMNASMNDTHNLAWKLAHVLRGWSDISSLKTYEFERRKYAQDLIDFDRKFSALFSGKPRTEDNDDGVSHEEFLGAFQAFGAFTSGIGVHYAPSVFVNTTHQARAPNLIIGQRMPPQVFIRGADARPLEIQDLLPADTRFKILVFAGDTADPQQFSRVQTLAEELGRPDAFLKRFSAGKGDVAAVFDVLTITASKKEQVEWIKFPPLLRSHWSKILIDDVDMRGRSGGGGYASYGIDNNGAIVVVRPDGYVGTVAPLDRPQDISDYFANFMTAL